MNRQFGDRGVSIAVTHVLAIGISTILVAGLLMGASTMLDNQRESSVESSLEAVGERLAGEIAGVDRANATVNTTHPRSVSGTSYTVNASGSGCGALIDDNDVDYCLRLEALDEDVEIFVPFSAKADVKGENNAPVRGGPIDIVYENGGSDGEIILKEGS